MRVVFLGTSGGPVIASDRSRCGQAILVDVGGELMLFDCGRRASEQAADAGYSLLDIHRVLFSHLHSGHTAGYPDFVLSAWNGGLSAAVPGRSTPLLVYGPRGIRRMTERLFGPDGAYCTDLAMRTRSDICWGEFRAHSHRLALEWPLFSITEITRLTNAGIVCGTLDWQVRAAFASHGGADLPCLAYRVDSGGHSLVVAADTSPAAGVVSLARDADVLVHDGACVDELSGAMADRHSTAIEAGRAAADAGVGKLIITSIPSCADHDSTLTEIQRLAAGAFGGPVMIAHDQMVIDL